LSAEDIRRLCAVPDVQRSEGEDLRDYAGLIQKIRRQHGARLPGRGVKRCANPSCSCTGGLFRPREGEPWVQFRRRRFCSNRCAMLVREGTKAQARPSLPVRHCRGCGRELVRREGEEFRKFAARQHCDRSCQWKSQERTSSPSKPAKTS
jgi:endogenous inhibitor of DNA gyrase (YacG/DUF329 family)